MNKQQLQQLATALATQDAAYRKHRARCRECGGMFSKQCEKAVRMAEKLARTRREYEKAKGLK